MSSGLKLIKGLSNIILHIISLSLFLSLLACSSQENNNKNVNVYQGRLSEEEIDSLLEENIKSRLKADSNLRELREGGLKLAKYLRQEGETYFFDITEEEAAKLGISSNVYHYQVNELKKTNQAISRAKATGDSVSLIDFREIIKLTENE